MAPHVPMGVLNFNSHAHVERDVVGTKDTSIIRNFNSHAHVERDCEHIIVKIFTDISTHTLTWSVTEFVCKKCHDNFISTHTLTWSVTNFFKLR